MKTSREGRSYLQYMSMSIITEGLKILHIWLPGTQPDLTLYSSSKSLSSEDPSSGLALVGELFAFFDLDFFFNPFFAFVCARSHRLGL